MNFVRHVMSKFLFYSTMQEHNMEWFELAWKGP